MSEFKTFMSSKQGKRALKLALMGLAPAANIVNSDGIYAAWGYLFEFIVYGNALDIITAPKEGNLHLPAMILLNNHRSALVRGQ